MLYFQKTASAVLVIKQLKIIEYIKKIAIKDIKICFIFFARQGKAYKPYV